MPSTDPGRRKAVYVLLVGLALAVVTGLPFLLGALTPAPGMEFTGFILGVEDGNSYLAKMRQGAAGSWVYHLAFTPEPHDGGLFFIFYLLLGKLSVLTRIPPIWLFHLSRLIATPFGLYCFWRLAGHFSPSAVVRRWSVALFALGGGLGWLWALLGGSVELGRMPVDLWVPDASFFLSSLTYPHLTLGQGLLFLFILWSVRFIDGGPVRDGLLAATAGLGVSLIHPYTLPVIGVPLGLFALWRARGRASFAPLFRLLGALLPSAPYLLYTALVFARNGAFAAWQAQTGTYSPSPTFYLLGFGSILLLAAFGLAVRDASLLPTRAFLMIWTLVVPPLLYIPSPLQRRFLDGYLAPLALFAAAGLCVIQRRLRQPIVRRLALGAALATAGLTSAFLLIGSITTAGHRVPPVFRPSAVMAAARWFGDSDEPPVLLASYQTGNLLPAHSLVRSFVGHGSETIDSADKQALVRRFFATGTDDAWRADLLRRFGVRYVFHGPDERAQGAFEPTTSALFRLAFEIGDVRVFEVLSPPSP